MLTDPVKQVCAICRDQPLVFHECPDCSARYCASGCLRSWYEHTRSLRGEPIEVTVNSTDTEKIDQLKVKLQPDGDVVTFDLFRAAGGKVVAELDPEQRWGITSVDGWELGQPGPGHHWRPHRGVKLILEELGRCRKCKKQFAVPEYVCNSAARGTKSGNGSAPGRRVRTFEASTQTDATYQEMGTQTEAEFQEAEIQACSIQTLSRSQAALAGHALAALAAPGGDSSEMLLTSNPSLASRQLREALTQLRVASPNDPEARHQLQAAEEALQRLAPEGLAEAAASQESAEMVAPTPGEEPRGQGLRQALRHLRFQLPSFEADGLQQVLTALTSLSELLPLCMCPGVPSWRQVADSGNWPWRGTKDADAPGWSELKDALSALSQLAMGLFEREGIDATGADQSPQGFFRRAVRALHELVLFLDQRRRDEAMAEAQAAAAGATSLNPLGPATTGPSIGLTPGLGGLTLTPMGMTPMGMVPPGMRPLSGGCGVLSPSAGFGAAPAIQPLRGAMNPIDNFLATAPAKKPGLSLAMDAPMVDPLLGNVPAAPKDSTPRGDKEMRNAMTAMFTKKKR